MFSLLFVLDHGGSSRGASFPYIATTTKTDKNGKETLISIADGRSYLPVDEHKGYIGTSMGFMYSTMII